ncbi:MAG TPA: rhomboid family intramembrane serine protease [Solirubrobacteraceae bacterium]|nr:rhomboid family intramembrane serine protease [Solirubrobacteraceae bacterium]
MADRRAAAPHGAAGRRARRPASGLALLGAIVAVMWLLEAVNSLDHRALDADGAIYPRDTGRLWAILTSPFLHVSFQHLIDNTIPLLFMGVIVALRGAARLAAVTLIVIVVAGLGTWLIAPAHTATVGASGLVFGYATYLLVRGVFDRSALEVVVGALVGAVWGAALLASIVPHTGVSWQDHVSGALGGVLAAWALAGRDRRRRRVAAGGGSQDGIPDAHRPLHEALDRVL